MGYQLHIAVPAGPAPLLDSAWAQLESFSSALVAGISDHGETETNRFDVGDTICVLPFVRSRSVNSHNARNTNLTDLVEFEAALVFHLGIDSIRAAHLNFVRSFADRCVGTLDGLSRTHERLELWAEEIRTLQSVSSFEDFHRSLESLSKRLFDGTAVVFWQVGLGIVEPRYCSPQLHELDLEASAEDIRKGDDEPEFFGGLHSDGPRWLQVVKQALTRELRDQNDLALASASRRSNHGDQSVSGFLIPARTRESYYLVSIVRGRPTRCCQMDLALCHALQPVFARILDRLEAEVNDARIELDGRAEMIDQRLLSNFCHVVEQRVDGSSVLLLYADQDLKAVSLADHDGATALADEIGLIMPSASTLVVPDESAFSFIAIEKSTSPKPGEFDNPFIVESRIYVARKQNHFVPIAVGPAEVEIEGREWRVFRNPSLSPDQQSVYFLVPATMTAWKLMIYSLSEDRTRAISDSNLYCVVWGGKIRGRSASSTAQGA